MKKTFTILFIALAAMTSCSQKGPWKVVWQENFKGQELDTTVWSRIDRGRADWNNFMSKEDRLYDVKDGMLILKGMKNDNLTRDTATYITGGVWTKGKHAFMGGKIEIRARLHGATGAWPAFWLLPFDTQHNKWPDGGEVDIMERLNNDSIAYQTVHSHYTYTLKLSETPPHGGIGTIKRDGFNTYAVEFYPDSLVFSINGKKTFSYPKIETDKPGQFPYYKPMFLMLDMQLGGKWVGRVDPNDLPVQMEIDWVKHYQRKK